MVFWSNLKVINLQSSSSRLSLIQQREASFLNNSVGELQLGHSTRVHYLLHGVSCKEADHFHRPIICHRQSLKGFALIFLLYIILCVLCVSIQEFVVQLSFLGWWKLRKCEFYSCRMYLRKLEVFMISGWTLSPRTTLNPCFLCLKQDGAGERNPKRSGSSKWNAP